jgi:hypothetical protein
MRLRGAAGRLPLLRASLSDRSPAPRSFTHEQTSAKRTLSSARIQHTPPLDYPLPSSPVVAALPPRLVPFPLRASFPLPLSVLQLSSSANMPPSQSPYVNPPTFDLSKLRALTLATEATPAPRALPAKDGLIAFDWSACSDHTKIGRSRRAQTRTHTHIHPNNVAH